MLPLRYAQGFGFCAQHDNAGPSLPRPAWRPLAVALAMADRHEPYVNAYGVAPTMIRSGKANVSW